MHRLRGALVAVALGGVALAAAAPRGGEPQQQAARAIVFKTPT